MEDDPSAEFAFVIQSVLPPIAGQPGDATISGRPVGRGDPAIGDAVVVPLADGRVGRAVIVAFPPVRLNDPKLRAVSLDGVRATDIQVGGLVMQR